MKTTLVVMAGAMSCGLAVAPPGLAAQSQSAGNARTASFVRRVASSDMMEIAISRLAQDKGGQGEKSFAATMIKDHTKASDELKSLVADMGAGLNLPTALGPKDQETVDRLAKLTGARFDNQFKATQIQAHKVAISAFRAYARGGDNAGLKAWAVKTLPTLEHHLKMAQQLTAS